MTNLDTLMKRIDHEIAAEVHQQKASWAEMVEANRACTERLQHYETAARHIIELLKPRLDVFTQRFKPVVKVEPLLREHSCTVTLSFAATVARVSLRFAMSRDQKANHVRLECIQDIIPVLFEYDKLSAVEFPFDSVQDDAVVRWFDDRLVAFVKAYIAIVRQDAALRVLLKDFTVEDPVAGVRFPKYLAAATLERNGRTYYFVDEDTRRQFEQQPAAK